MRLPACSAWHDLELPNAMGWMPGGPEIVEHKAVGPAPVEKLGPVDSIRVVDAQ